CKKDGAIASKKIMLVHAIPGAPETDVLFNDQVKGRVKYLSNTGYVSVKPEGSVVNAKLNNVGQASSIVNEDVSVGKEEAYTVFATAKDGAAKYVTLKDDYPRIKKGKAMVRIVHLSPNLPMVALKNELGSVLSANVGYGSAGGFIEVNAGKSDLKVVDFKSGQDTFFLTNTQLKEKTAYTLLVRGMIGGQGDQAVGGTFVAHK
ncbi:MAG: DUF4397 domain-containing protein, partial [Chitinophagales bacterium]